MNAQIIDPVKAWNRYVCDGNDASLDMDIIGPVAHRGYRLAADSWSDVGASKQRSVRQNPRNLNYGGVFFQRFMKNLPKTARKL